jgi:hypothetical protein
MEWTILKKFPNYEINKLGQVRNMKTNKILSQSLSTKGYYQINIDNKSRRTHRLLAETFIYNPNNYETVNHIDGNKLNNALCNLEWLSRSDNVKHSREVLNLTPIPYSKSNKAHHLKGKFGENSNSGIKIKAVFTDNTFKIFGSAEDASRELFGDCKYGKCIRQSIKRRSTYYKTIKFENYE